MHVIGNAWKITKPVSRLSVKSECESVCCNSAFYLYLVPVSLSDVFIAGENWEMLHNLRQSVRFFPMPDPSKLFAGNSSVEIWEDVRGRCPRRPIPFTTLSWCVNILLT